MNEPAGSAAGGQGITNAAAGGQGITNEKVHHYWKKFVKFLGVINQRLGPIFAPPEDDAGKKWRMEGWRGLAVIMMIAPWTTLRSETKPCGTIHLDLLYCTVLPLLLVTWKGPHGCVVLADSIGSLFLCQLITGVVHSHVLLVIAIISVVGSASLEVFYFFVPPKDHRPVDRSGSAAAIAPDAEV